MRNAGDPIEREVPQSDGTASRSAWSTVSDEVVGIRELLDELTSDEPNDPIMETPQTDRIQSFDVLLYGDASCFVQPHVLKPPPSMMVSALVDIYLYRIDQIIKVTHTPSLCVSLLTTDTTESMNPVQEALRFAVFFAAVNSLNEQECLQHFNASKNSLSSRFELATEVLLSRAGLLTTTNLTVLQAFLIYLVRWVIVYYENGTDIGKIGLRARNGSRAVSTLVATAVNIAQSLGLDLETTSQTPFETELRRRTWYSIAILDLQTAFDSGSRLTLACGAFSGPAPLHVNDADISPADLEPARERFAITDMTFCCATHDMLRYMRRMIHASNDADGRPLLQQDWAQRQAIVEDCAQTLNQKYLINSNDTNSFQRFTRAVCKGMLVTLRLLARRPMYRFCSSKPPPDDEFNVLEVSANVLARALQKSSDDEFKPWKWFTWLKWYALAVLLAELCEHTEGQRVDEVWLIAEASFLECKDMLNDPVLWSSLKKLMRKARSARCHNGNTAESGGSSVFDDKNYWHLEGPGDAASDLDPQFLSTTGCASFGQQESLSEELELFSWVNWESFVEDISARVQSGVSNGYEIGVQ